MCEQRGIGHFLPIVEETQAQHGPILADTMIMNELMVQT